MITEDYNDFQISLRLDKHGWSDLDIWTRKKHLNYSVTHSFNCPFDQIITALKDLLEGKLETKFLLCEEPGEHTWTIKRNIEEHHVVDITMESVDDNFVENLPPYEVHQFKLETVFFIDSFICELVKVSKQLEYKTFSKDRKGDFPWMKFTELKKIIKEKRTRK